MNRVTKHLKEWLGFTRRERRATSILLFIILMIIGIRVALPDGHIEVQDITGTLDDTEVRPQNVYNKKSYIHDTSRVAVHKVYPGMTNNNRKVAYVKSGMNKKPPVDINRCDSAELVGLPGIGPVLSARIIKYRNFLGGFAYVEQLKEVYGLKEETFETIKGRIFADSSFIKRISINTAVFRELARIRYLEKFEITSILKYRQLKGRISGIDELTAVKVIPVEKARKIRPYVSFE